MNKILKDFTADFSCDLTHTSLDIHMIPTDFDSAYFYPNFDGISITDCGNIENYPLLSEYLSTTAMEELESIGAEAQELYNEHIVGIEENDDEMDVEIIIEDYNDRIRDLSDECLEIILSELEAQKEKLEDWFFVS